MEVSTNEIVIWLSVDARELNRSSGYIMRWMDLWSLSLNGLLLFVHQINDCGMIEQKFTENTIGCLVTRMNEIYWWNFVNIWADDHGGIKNLSFGFDSLQSSLLFGGHRESSASRLSKTDLSRSWVAVESQLSRSWVAVESQLSRSPGCRCKLWLGQSD